MDAQMSLKVTVVGRAVVHLKVDHLAHARDLYQQMRDAALAKAQTIQAGQIFLGDVQIATVDFNGFLKAVSFDF